MWQLYSISGTEAMQKKTSLCELLDKLVDAQRLDIKAHFSGHLNESKLYCPPCQIRHSSWTGQNRSPLMLHSESRPGINARTQDKVKKHALIDFTGDAQMKQHYKLKLLKPPNFPKLAMTVDSKHMTSNAASSHVLSTLEPQDVCQDDHTSNDKQHLPVQKTFVQKNVRECDSAGNPASQLPITDTSLPNIVPTYLKATTKKDQFRKMRDYHNIIQCPSHVHQHTLTGCDAVKYLEHHLQEV